MDPTLASPTAGRSIRCVSRLPSVELSAKTADGEEDEEEGVEEEEVEDEEKEEEEGEEGEEVEDSTRWLLVPLTTIREQLVPEAGLFEMNRRKAAYFMLEYLHRKTSLSKPS